MWRKMDIWSLDLSVSNRMNYMEDLLQKMQELEAELGAWKLSHPTPEIDLNHPNWLEIAQGYSRFFYEAHQSEIQEIIEKLISKFPQLSIGRRQDIWDLIKQLNYLPEMLYKDDALFEDHVLLWIIRNGGKDPRDSMVEIDNYIRDAKGSGINYSLAIETLLPLADNRPVSHFFGSIQQILEQIINRES